MPLESPVGPQNRWLSSSTSPVAPGTVVKPPIEWIAGQKGEFVNVVRFDGFTDQTSLDIPNAMQMTICFLMVGS
jgi:hypothetical protein